MTCSSSNLDTGRFVSQSSPSRRAAASCGLGIGRCREQALSKDASAGPAHVWQMMRIWHEIARFALRSGATFERPRGRVARRRVSREVPTTLSVTGLAPPSRRLEICASVYTATNADLRVRLHAVRAPLRRARPRRRDSVLPVLCGEEGDPQVLELRHRGRPEQVLHQLRRW